MNKIARIPQYEFMIELGTFLKKNGRTTINSYDIKEIIKEINKKHNKEMYKPDDIKCFVNDLKTIFDVSKKVVSVTEYTIGIEIATDTTGIIS